MPNKITCDAAGKLRFYAVEQLGPKQSITPEGFLICHDVPIARTGNQLYLAEEVPIEAGPDGVVTVVREEAEVFRPETIASFEGKPVTIDHPDDFVSPENWKELAVGLVQNVRRGEGQDKDLLIADLLITDRDAINKVRAGLREVSCGYDADYEQLEPGKGAQTNIIGNHVALVVRGRAGRRCAIQDKEPITMKRSWKDRIWAAFGSRDAEGLEEALKEGEGKKTDDEDESAEQEKKSEGPAKTGDRAVLDSILSEVKKLSKRVGDVETAMEEAKKTDDEDESAEPEKKADEEETTDTVIGAESAGKADPGTTHTGDAFRAVLANAEILSPGFSIPTGDSIGKAGGTDHLKRKVLKTAMTSDSASLLAPLFAGRSIDTLSGAALDALFTASAELVKANNNRAGVRHSVTVRDFGSVSSPAAINKAAQEFWASRK